MHPFFLFFALSAPPFPTQFSSPKSPLSGTSHLLFLVEKRQLTGAGFGDGSGRGRPTGKKGKSFFFWRAKKGEFFNSKESSESSQEVSENFGPSIHKMKGFLEFTPKSSPELRPKLGKTNSWEYHYTQYDYRTELYYFRIIFAVIPAL